MDFCNPGAIAIMAWALSLAVALGLAVAPVLKMKMNAGKKYCSVSNRIDTQTTRLSL